MRFLLYKEKIMLLIASLFLIALLVITIYFSINYDRFEYSKIAILTSEEFNENVEKVSRNNNISIYSIQNLNPNSIVKEIEKIYHNYTSFIIVIEKENIPFIASHVAFMVENLTKSIVFTEKQNLLEIVKKIPSIVIPEVIVNNGKQLLRGVTTILNKKGDLISYKYPELNHLNSLEFPKEPLVFKYIDPKITISFDIKNDKTDAIIIDNIPITTEILQNKKLILILSEKHLEKIPSFDMTREAAYAKLVFLLSNVKDQNILKQLLSVNFRGEIIN